MIIPIRNVLAPSVSQRTRPKEHLALSRDSQILAFNALSAIANQLTGTRGTVAHGLRRFIPQ